MSNKMKIEVWSDIMCPFCYIGKRRYEAALQGFANADQVELVWKSYQLDPNMQTNLAQSTYEHLAASKGMPLAQAKAMCDQVTQMAKEVGLDYDFDKAVVANSMKAHEFSHFAKSFAKQGEAEELLFEAYFTHGKNVDDIEVLKEMATDLGLDAAALELALKEGRYTDAVREDIYEAQQVGVRGVPFFVFNRKYAISGAQDVSVFKQTLENAFAEWQKENVVQPLTIIDGQSCGPEGCE